MAAVTSPRGSAPRSALPDCDTGSGGRLHCFADRLFQIQGEAYEDLVLVLEYAGRGDEAVDVWREALDRYERKRLLPLAHRLREQLASA